MSWYYMKRGDVRSRSILTDEQLKMMARAGEIGERDLLWGSTTDGKWIRAEAISDLFPVEEVPASPQPPSKEESIEEPKIAPPEKHRSKMSAVVAVTVAIAAVVAVLCGGKIRELLTPEPPPPPQQPPAPVETNTWETVEQDVANLIASTSYYQAQTLIADYMSDKGRDAVSVRMTEALRTALDKDKLAQLYQAFIQGRITEEEKGKMIALAKTLKVDKDLVKSLHNILDSPKVPSAGRCLEILDLAEALGDRALAVAAIDKYAAHVDFSTSEKACMELAHLYTGKKEDDKAIAILQKFTVWHPESPAAWLELAALLAIKGQEDQSLVALKTAVKHGDELTKKAAREDKRFDSVRDTWRFGRYTK